MQGGGLTIREMCESAKGEPGQLLPELAETGAETGTGGLAGCDTAVGAERSALWIPANRASG